MTILADTNVLIDNLRGHAEALTAFMRARDAGERLVASVLTKVELLAGRRPGEEAAMGALLAEFEWVEVDNSIAERAGALAAEFRDSHPGIEIVDYVIAATAQLRHAELWTRNRRHFPMFPALADPYQP